MARRRGYTLEALVRDGADLVVHAALPGATSTDVLRFDPESLARLRAAAASDRDRDARPPLYPTFD